MNGVEVKGRSFLGIEIEVRSASLNDIREGISSIRVDKLLLNSFIALSVNEAAKPMTKEILSILREKGIHPHVIEVKDKTGLEEAEIPVIELKDTKTLSKGEEKKVAVFKGNLRSGQLINTNGTLVVTGNINSNAYVNATEDIYVLGTLDGIPHAGFGGNQKAIIFAFEINSPQIRIGDIISRAPEQSVTPKHHNHKTIETFEVAFVENNTIIVTSYTEWLQSNRRKI